MARADIGMLPMDSRESLQKSLLETSQVQPRRRLQIATRLFSATNCQEKSGLLKMGNPRLLRWGPRISPMARPTRHQEPAWKRNMPMWPGKGRERRTGLTTRLPGLMGSNANGKELRVTSGAKPNNVSDRPHTRFEMSSPSFGLRIRG